MKYKDCKYIKGTPTERQLRQANYTIGADEAGILIGLTNKLEHTPVKKLEKLKLARAAFSRKQVRFKHLLQWDQKYKKLPHLPESKPR